MDDYIAWHIKFKIDNDKHRYKENPRETINNISIGNPYIVFICLIKITLLPICTYVLD